MPDASLVGKGANARPSYHFPRLAGAVTALFGGVIIISWYAHWQLVLQMLPRTAPMQYNTALCFILSGVGLFLLAISRARMASWLGGAVAFFTLLTLLEYLLGLDLGIDQIFFKPYFEAATNYPGRMSPLTAVCFVFIGAGILLPRAAQAWRPRLAGTGLLACVVGVIASVALLGFAFGVEPAYGWGAYSSMAVNTAALLLLLGAGLLSWSLQMARTENYDFLRWLPVSGSAALMAMIAFVAAANTMELRKATFWRKHTFEVILQAQAFEENLIDLQRGVRGYITLGDTNSLVAFQASRRLEPAQFKQLVELTADNPEQQKRLKNLHGAMDEVFSYDERMIGIFNRAGAKAAADADPAGQRGALSGIARGIVTAFSRAEKRLLSERDVSEQKESSNAERLLLFGSVMAGALLVLANYLASREMRRRRRAELEREKVIGELQQALAEVKTLSGMIPICAWCKSIRSDQGFWQSVEDYVRTRTDATFSHGVCPACAKKVREELAQGKFRPAAVKAD